MSGPASTLGTCPFCGTAIPEGSVLIRYEVDGFTRVFAECPDCEDPVGPR